MFAGVYAYDFNIDADAAEARLSERTKAIVPLHLCRQSCDQPAVTALAKRHILFVVAVVHNN